ncbi:MAG: ribonuclease P protein component [Bacilli bacterium]|nr:ribonuclease P protein component [Bacilli bacterium]
MKKINIIKKNYDINNIINKRNMIKNKYFYIYKDNNSINNYRFAICVSKKIGNAVTRNKIKRQIKDILDKSNLVFKTNNDYVIIIRNEINNLNYKEIKENLINLISKVLD